MQRHRSVCPPHVHTPGTLHCCVVRLVRETKVLSHLLPTYTPNLAIMCTPSIHMYMHTVGLGRLIAMVLHTHIHVHLQANTDISTFLCLYSFIGVVGKQHIRCTCSANCLCHTHTCIHTKLNKRQSAVLYVCTPTQLTVQWTSSHY